ncbi:MAG: hypothetical protein E7331_08835 [Clostridiales bacterium]|nr:hypothetical protein [Clostridiales bacterium]
MNVFGSKSVSWECRSCHKLNHPACGFCEHCGKQKGLRNLTELIELLIEKVADLFGNKTGTTVKAPTALSQNARVCQVCGSVTRDLNRSVCQNCGSLLPARQQANLPQQNPQFRLPQGAQPYSVPRSRRYAEVQTEAGRLQGAPQPRPVQNPARPPYAEKQMPAQMGNMPVPRPGQREAAPEIPPVQPAGEAAAAHEE